MYGLGSGRLVTTPPGPAPPTPTGYCFSLSGSPAQVQDANSLDSSSSSSIPFSLGLRSPGKVSPLRGRTMKEYEEQLGNLKKENFSLKLRIYFLEERMGQKYDKEDKDELYKTNIELKVETEALKQELYDKQELVRQASTALSGLEQQFQEQVAQIKDQHEQEKEKLQTHVEQLQKEVDDHVHRFREERGRLGELSQLCGLAFSTETEEQEEEEQLPETLRVAPPSKDNLSLPLNLDGFNNFTAESPVQGLFSMPATLPPPAALDHLRPAPTADDPGEGAADVQAARELAEEKVSSLKARVVELENLVTELEGELAAKEETTCILEGDLANLQKELEDKVETIADLETEVTEKDLKIDGAMQELETRYTEIRAKDDQIQSLHYDLNRVEPEIEVKVQEIVERDRIIEEKIEKIEQQNKILVEIQITLDEKQKQIADMEHKITESSEKIKKLTEDLDKSCKVIQTFAEEVQARDKEIAALRKEVKRKEKKIRDLVAELKEALDMLNKAKWEAETSGGEDGVKEMAEEENERLWAELESRNNEVLAIRAEHKHTLSEAEERANRLQRQLDEKIKVLEGERGKHGEETEEREVRLREQSQRVARLEGELEALRGDVSSREGLLRTNRGLVLGLEEELTAARDQLKERRTELDVLQGELKKKNADMQDLVNRELWERNREVERLQEKLGALTTDRRQQIESLKDELETKNGELRRLSSRPNRDDGAPTTDRPENAVRPTAVTGSGDADSVAANRPSRPTFADEGSAPVQIVYGETGKVRSEAEAVSLERTMLNDKLSSLQHLYDNVRLTNTIVIHEQMGSVKKRLDDAKEDNSPEELKRGEMVDDFQSRVLVLRTELNDAKEEINRRLTEVTVCKYREALKRHKQEIASLRKRLADSHNACDLLRTRLEELADFLERILEMEEKGLINLSRLSPKQLASIHETLNESRALSRSLSQSLMIGVDSTDHGDDDATLSGSVSSVSSWSLQRDDGLDETRDYPGAGSQEAVAGLPDETPSRPEDSRDPAVRELAAQLDARIDRKAREIDAIAENASALGEKLAERTRQVEQQAGVIGELRGQVGHLQDEVRRRDLRLLASGAEQNGDGGRPALRSSWQSSLNPLAASSQSTVHAVSPQTTVHTHDSSSQESLHKSTGNCSDTLPPPPLHLLQDSECEVRPDIREMEICHASDRSSLSAVKSAYSTDAAIKAYSGHLGYFQQHVTPGEKTRVEGQKPRGENTNGAAGSCAAPEQPWQPVSPSESEAWSEPDRNVSLARIGLDACTLGGAPDRALSRSRQQRASAAITSESDGEAAQEDTATCTANAAPAQGKVTKRRSDVAELRKVSTRLRAVEQLNDTLRAELNIYQTLSQQMGHEPQDQRPTTSDKSVETHKGETVDASVGAEEVSALPPPPPTFAIPAPLLDEIRALRLKLEEAIANNDHLRDQLEAALTAHPQDEARFYHLTAALQTAQEEMREARDRLQGSQEAVREQQEKYSKIELKLQECEGHLSHCQVQLEASQTEASAAKADLCKAHQLLQEKESLIKEHDAQLVEKEQSIRELVDKIDQLEKDAANNPDNDEQLQKLQLELQQQESRLLQVNKERLSLVGERARLQAQLASVSTHARLLQEGQQDAEGAGEEHISVLRQLEAERATVVTLQQERKQLLTEKEHFEKEMQVLQEEVASLRARVEHLTSRRVHDAQQADDEKKNTRELRNEHVALQRDHGELRCRAHNFEVELRNLREKQKTSEDSQRCMSEQTTLVKQLTAELESERCLTSNLQLQLEVVRGSTSPTTSQCDDSVVPRASDSRGSHESVTSIEFFHPLPDPSVLWSGRATSLGPTSLVDKEKGRERRASSGSRRRDGSKRSSGRRSEDKENLHCTTATATAAGKRSRRSHGSNSGEGAFSLLAVAQPLLPEEEGDGGTTSGESPDLGIGSDYHFSSLERGTRTLRSIVRTAHDLPPPPLCSQPSLQQFLSHSALSVENQQLRLERNNLSSKLASTKETLEEALEKLSKANQRKENVERAICKQLYKTHNVLKKAKTHLKQANSLPQ